ncbi:MAG: ribonuclease P protein component [Verrucomicrobiota bacterium]
MKMPRSMRMRRRDEFLAVRRAGETSRGKFLVLSYLSEPSIAKFKFGFITSKRVGNAVVRNRVRRRLREIVRGEGERLRRGSYVVTIARWRAGEATFDELRREWLGLAKGCGLLTEGSGGE